jgi:FkbM family methyltransferase
MQLYRNIKYLLSHPIGRKNKLKSLSNWLKWQVTQKILQRPVLMPFIGDSTFLVRKSMTGATGNIYSGLHEFEEMAFLLHFLDKEDVFFDVGANVGSYTILASKVIGAISCSFEPSPVTFHHLENNIFLNRIQNKVFLFNKGVGAEKGSMQFSVNQDTINHIVLDGQEESITVEITTLDQHSTEQNLIPNLIKVDVEGFETEVIRGANSLLKNEKLQAVILELNGSGSRYGFDEDAIHKKMIDSGFKAYRYLPFNRKLEIRENRSFHGNTIYINQIELVQKRINNAPYFEALGVRF